MFNKKLGLIAAILTLGVLPMSNAFAGELHAQTKKNLETAMRGEAYANLKYMTYAEHARSRGNEELARVYEESANVEANEHFAREADALGLSKGKVADLKNSMEGEYYENTTMYKEFAEQAREVGDLQVADLFEQIRADEGDHYEAYKAALAKVKK